MNPQESSRYFTHSVKMNQFKEQQEIAWDTLSQFPGAPAPDSIPGGIEWITTDWKPRPNSECPPDTISWLPSLEAFWNQAGGPLLTKGGISRLFWFDKLCSDISQRWQPQGSSWDTFCAMDAGTYDESWSAWWARMRGTDTKAVDVARAAWLLQTWVRSHPHLFLHLQLQKKNAKNEKNGDRNEANGIESHPLGAWSSPTVWDCPNGTQKNCVLVLEETIPLDCDADEEDKRLLRNWIQEFVGTYQTIPEEWCEGVSGLTWRILWIPDGLAQTGFDIDEEPDRQPWKADYADRWKCGWDISGTGAGWDRARQRLETHAWIDALVHPGTIDRLAGVQHRQVATTSWWLGYIWRRWACYHLPVRDRLRFVVAGGMVKASYGLRDAKDLDFLVLDHHGDLEGHYHPDLGSGKLKHFHDFGRTYYPCERYFFPTRPDWYQAQKKYSRPVSKETGEAGMEEGDLFGSQWIPKFSASGLKASRYFPIFQWLWERYRTLSVREDPSLEDEIPPLDTLDDLMVQPQFGFYRWGIRFAPIEWEFQRDHLKDLDLGWVSKKQIGDIERFRQYYGLTDALGFLKNSQGQWIPSLSWKWNIYHGEVVKDSKTDEPAGLRVLIRRAPLALHKIIQTWILESGFPQIQTEWSPQKPWRVEYQSSGFVVHHWNDWIQQTFGMEQLTARNVLLSSLPPTLDHDLQDRTVSVPAVWWWVLTVRGELHVQLWVESWNLGCAIPHLTKGEPWVAAGTGQVLVDDAKQKAKWVFHIQRTEESAQIWGHEGLEKPMERANLSRFLTSLKYKFLEQKTFDAQQQYAWQVEYVSQPIVPDWVEYPWTQRLQKAYESLGWADRWIPAPNPQRWCPTLASQYQAKYGFCFSEDPRGLFRKILAPKLKTKGKGKGKIAKKE